jgi:DNA-binding response OmpR family regulator
LARPAIVVALPPSESIPVSAELLEADFEVITVEEPDELIATLAVRRDVAVAILDGEADEDLTGEYWVALRNAGRPIPALTVVSSDAYQRLAEMDDDGSGNEYFTRPYSADSIRWRVEAMCIRRETVDDGSGPVLQAGPIGHDGWTRLQSSPSSIPRAALARRPWRPTSPRRSRSARGSPSCSSMPTP